MAGPTIDFSDPKYTSAPPSLRKTKEQLEVDRLNQSLANAKQTADIKQRVFEAAYGDVKVPGDATKTGEEYLKTLPAGLASQIRAMAEGRLAMPANVGSRNPRALMLNAAVQQYDPTADAATVKARQATRNDFASGASAKTITSLNTAIGHLTSLKGALDDLHNSGFTAWNAIANPALAAMGGTKMQAALNRYNSIVGLAAPEVLKATTGKAPTQRESFDYANNFSSSSSPEGLEGAISGAVGLLQTRLGQLGDQYNRGLKTTSKVDPSVFLTDESKRNLAKLGFSAGPPSSGTPGGTAPGGAPGGAPASGATSNPAFERDVAQYMSSRSPDKPFKADELRTLGAKYGQAISNADAISDYYNKYGTLNPSVVYATPGGQTVSGAAQPGASVIAAGAPSAQPSGPLDVASTMARGAVGDIGEIGSGLYQTIRHPLDTAAALGNIGGGVLGKLGFGNFDQSAANAVGKYFSDRYGSVDNIMRSVEQHPVETAADVASLLTGGGALLRAAGKAGELANVARAGELAQVGSKLGAAGAAIDPVAAGMRGLGSAGAGAGALFSKYAPTAVDALRATTAGGQRAAEFTGQMRGTEDPTRIIDLANEGLDALHQQRSSQYKAGMASGDIRDPVVLDTAKAKAAVDDVAGRGFFSPDTESTVTFNKDPATVPVLSDIKNAVNEFEQLPVKAANEAYDAMKPDERAARMDDLGLDPAKLATSKGAAKIKKAIINQLVEENKPVYHSVLGFDALKQRLANSAQNLPLGSTQRSMAEQVADAVRKTIIDQAPGYADVMKDYHDASDQLREITGGTGVGGKATDATAYGKLQSAYTSDNPVIKQAVQALDDATEGKLGAALAGQTYSSAFPGKTAAVPLGALALDVGAMATHPQYVLPGLAAGAVLSPRLQGEALRAIGAASRTAGPVGDKLVDLLGKYGLGAYEAGHTAREGSAPRVQIKMPEPLVFDTGAESAPEPAPSATPSPIPLDPAVAAMLTDQGQNNP
jgi:hypothetical protein